jgi:hypothetical protein
MSTSDRSELRVDPTTPAVGAEPVQEYVPNRVRLPSGEPRVVRAAEQERGASTDGHLRAAYAQYVVDADTHEVSLRIRDAATDEVIRQMPAAEIAAVNKALREYAEALARRHAAAQAKAGG